MKKILNFAWDVVGNFFFTCCIFITFMYIPFTAGMTHASDNPYLYYGLLTGAVVPGFLLGIAVTFKFHKKIMKENIELTKQNSEMRKMTDKVMERIDDMKSHQSEQFQEFLADFFEDTPIDTYYIKGRSDDDDEPELYLILSDGECTIEHFLGKVEDGGISVDAVTQFEEAKMAWYAERNKD